MHLARRIYRLPKLSRSQIPSSASNRTQSTAVEERIEIPYRIKRSPTDILYALSSTVGRDSTAAHYKYHDDPYLIPSSNVAKRTFAVAQEAGRKAARWIKQEHSKNFLHQEAQPPIEAFAPKMVFTADSEVNEEILNRLIMHSDVKDAAFVYNLMKEKNIEISSELKQSMLELICFYNNEEPLPDEDIEERWFIQNASARDRQRKTWKDGDLAENIFAEIEPKTSAAYCALIRGMAKYYQAERAFALLQEATEKQFEVDTNTYNYVIATASLLKETADLRWEFCLDLLQRMAQQKLMPNLYTLNAVLETVSTFNNFKFARSCALKALAEFTKLGIEPSLGTFYYILIIFCRERAPVSHVLVDILNEIKGKHFSIEHPKDTFFFTTAMDICRNQLRDRSICKKVDEVLHTGNNYDLIGDTYKESVYYRHYFGLLCNTEPIEEFMETYDLLVPNIYIPEPGIMEEILKAVESNGAIELMPRLWSDILIFGHTNRESLLKRTLQILVSHEPKSEKSEQQQQLAEQFGKVALDIYNKIEDSDGRAKQLSFTGQIIGDILTLLVRSGKHFEKVIEVFKNIDDNQHRIPGTPTDACMLEFIDCCITNKAPTQAILCLQYAVDNHMESLPMAQKIIDGFTLNEVHLSKIKSLVGDDIVKKCNSV